MRRTFKHDNFGDTARVELCDNEVAIVFVADTKEKAKELAAEIMSNLEEGDLRIRMTGKTVLRWDLDEQYDRPN